VACALQYIIHEHAFSRSPTTSSLVVAKRTMSDAEDGARRHSDPCATTTLESTTTTPLAQSSRICRESARPNLGKNQCKRSSSSSVLFAAPNQSLDRVIAALNQQIALPQTPVQTPRDPPQSCSSPECKNSLGYSVPPLPANEAHRLDTLEQLRLLDTAAEIAFDNLVQLAGEICDTPIALMSLIDSNRQWFKSRVGLDADETPRSVSFCGHAIAQAELECCFEVPDATKDERFAGNPFVLGASSIRFYAGQPLLAANGAALGTLCVVDRRPRQLTDAQRTMLKMLGKQIEAEIELRRLTQAVIDQHELATFLLDATLPRHIVDKLKSEPKLPIASHHDAASVMFVDLVGFTALSARIGAARLVNVLSELFGAFDIITSELGLLKIKTMGDGYMLVGGIPLWRVDHASACVRAAALFMATLRRYLHGGKQHDLQVRIGLNSGPLVSGVISATQVTFDVFGDTVNVASRLEANAPVGCVCISSVTKQFLEAETFGHATYRPQIHLH
jgi:adenylate cyclase